MFDPTDLSLRNNGCSYTVILFSLNLLFIKKRKETKKEEGREGKKEKEKKCRVLGCNLVEECLPRIHKALSSILNPTPNKRGGWEGKEKEGERDTERKKERDRQTDRQRGRQRKSQREGHAHSGGNSRKITSHSRPSLRGESSRSVPSPRSKTLSYKYKQEQQRVSSYQCTRQTQNPATLAD